MPLHDVAVEPGRYTVVIGRLTPDAAGPAGYAWRVELLASAGNPPPLSVGAASLAVTWWSWPLDGAVSQTRGGLPDHLTPVTFAMRGVVPVGGGRHDGAADETSNAAWIRLIGEAKPVGRLEPGAASELPISQIVP